MKPSGNTKSKKNKLPVIASNNEISDRKSQKLLLKFSSRLFFILYRENIAKTVLNRELYISSS